MLYQTEILAWGHLDGEQYLQSYQTLVETSTGIVLPSPYSCKFYAKYAN